MQPRSVKSGSNLPGYFDPLMEVVPSSNKATQSSDKQTSDVARKAIASTSPANAEEIPRWYHLLVAKKLEGCTNIDQKEYKLFYQELYRWIKKDIAREALVHRLLDAFFTNVLNLSHCQLNELPFCIGMCKKLTELDVSSNKLTSLPYSLSECKELRKLNVAKNKLQSLPDLSECSKLEELDLSKNNLESLPVYFQKLTKLKRLDVSGNSKLEELPMCLSQLLDLSDICIVNTKIEYSERESILAVSRAADVNQLKRILSSRLNAWKVLGESKVDLKEIVNFSVEDMNKINLGLTRLERMKYSPGNIGFQKRLASVICGMLGCVLTNDKFKISFFAQAQKIIEHSEDKIPSLFKELYNTWQSEHCTQEMPLNGETSKKFIESIDEAFLVQTSNLESTENNNQRIELNSALQDWVNDPSTEGEKGLAAMLIKEAFQEKKLNLSRLQLNTLPACIGLLVDLKKIDLSYNKLTTLPETIRKCSKLQEVKLSSNNFKSVPSSLGELPLLSGLWLQENFELNELPLSLIGISNIIYMTTQGTKLVDAADAIKSLAWEMRKIKIEKIFPSRLKMWKRIYGFKVDLSGINGFDEGDQNQVNQWLMHLERSDYYPSQTKLAKKGCKVLKQVTKNEELKKIFLDEIKKSNEKGDVAAAVNILEYLL